MWTTTESGSFGSNASFVMSETSAALAVSRFERPGSRRKVQPWRGCRSIRDERTQPRSSAHLRVMRSVSMRNLRRSRRSDRVQIQYGRRMIVRMEHEPEPVTEFGLGHGLGHGLGCPHGIGTQSDKASCARFPVRQQVSGKHPDARAHALPRGAHPRGRAVTRRRRSPRTMRSTAIAPG